MICNRRIWTNLPSIPPRYVTIQRGRGTTPTTRDPEDKVGAPRTSNYPDTELVTLAELYRSLEAKRRVRRDSLDIVYPSDNLYSETPKPTFNVVWPISNDIEYVFPTGENSRYQVVEPAIIKPNSPLYQPSTTIPTPASASIHPNPTTHPSSTPPLPPTTQPPSVSSRVTQLPESWATGLPGAEIEFSRRDHPATESVGIKADDVAENKIIGDYSEYEDWGVVVSVVKSVSESDTTMIIPSATEKPMMIISQVPDTTVKIIEEMMIERTTKPETPKPHPFLATHHPILVSPKNRTSQTKPLNHKLHPFLNQIKNRTIASPRPTGISIIHINTTHAATSSTSGSTSTLPTTASPPSLFGRFNFINKKTARPVLKSTSTTADSSAAPHTGPSPSTQTNFLSSFKSRLLKRPPFKTLASQSSLEDAEKVKSQSFSKPSRALSNEVPDIEPTKKTPSRPTPTRKSLSRFGKTKSPRAIEPTKNTPSRPTPTRNSLQRFGKTKSPSTKRKSLFHPKLKSITKQPRHLVEKARTKRLPPAFSGLIKPRPSSFFKTAHNIESQSEEEEDSSKELVSPAPEGKQTVGDLLAALQGDPSSDEPVTLRPRAFKPKNGRSNQIREKLHDALAEQEEGRADNDKSEEDKDDKDDKQSTTVPSVAASIQTLVLPTRLTGAGRGLRRRRPDSRRQKGTQELRTGQAKEVPRSRNRLRVRPTATAPPTLTTVASVHILTEVDMMDKLGLTVVSSEQPDTTTDSSSDTSVSPTQSPFQVLLDPSDPEHEDHADHLTEKHSPEIHLRLLHTDHLIEEPRASSNEPSTAPFLPTLETPGITAFLPTMPEVNPTEARVQTTLPEPSTTTAGVPSSRGRSRSRSRSRHRLQVPTASRPEVRLQPAQQVSQPINRRLVRPRVRSRTRVATEATPSQGPEDESEKVVATSRARVASPRRFISRPRSQTQARSQDAPVFRAGSRSRVINQRLRIRGGSRSTTGAPETSTVVSEVTENDAEGKVANKIVTPEMGVTSKPTVVTNEPAVVTIEPTVVTIEHDVVTIENDVVTIEGESVVTNENDVVTTEQSVVTTEESVVTTVIGFLDNEEENTEKQQEHAMETEAAKVLKEGEKEEEMEDIPEVNEEELSTLRPSKFKPKFGADTRNRLREKMRLSLQKMADNKSQEANEEDVLLPTTLLPETEEEEETIFDSAFSDFDVPNSRQELEVRITPPPSFGSAEQRTGRLLGPSRSRLRSRGGVKRHTEGASRRRRLTQGYANTGAASELLRVGRSAHQESMITPVNIRKEMEEEEASRPQDMQWENEVEQAAPVRPFLLRSGRREKSIFKDRYNKEERRL